MNAVHRRVASVVAGFAVLGAWHPRTAAANGRYPFANQLVVDPSNADHLVARSTFGILDSRDGGVTWGWICETAVGYFGAEDPPIAVSADGSTLVAASTGLTVSRDSGCSWTKAGDGGARAGVDVTVDRTNPHEAVALESSSASTAVLSKTMDDGQTWTVVGPLPDGITAETVEIAPANPDRLYVTARTSPEQSSVFLRSDDGGQTWTSSKMDLPIGSAAFIGAVDPQSADVVYVRVRPPGDAPEGSVVVTRDAGATWSTIWAGPGEVLGFALSDDGAKLAIGGPDSGVRLAATSDMIFHEVNALRPYCLTWSGARLFGCGKEALDFFTIAVSRDDGATFAPVLHLPDVAPRDCGTATSSAVCALEWGPIAATIGASDAGTDAPGLNGIVERDEASKGCGCSMAARRNAEFGFWAMAALAVARAVRRRSGRREPKSCSRGRS